MQRDPLGYSEGPSLYEYVHSSPLNRIDPSGLNDPDRIPFTVEIPNIEGMTEEEEQDLEDAINEAIQENEDVEEEFKEAEQAREDVEDLDEEIEDIKNSIAAAQAARGAALAAGIGSGIAFKKSKTTAQKVGSTFGLFASGIALIAADRQLVRHRRKLKEKLLEREEKRRELEEETLEFLNAVNEVVEEAAAEHLRGG